MHFNLKCPGNSSFSEKGFFIPLLQNCKRNYPLISLFSKIPKCTLIFNDTLRCFAAFKASALKFSRYLRIQLPYKHIKMRCFQRFSVLNTSGFHKGSRQIWSADLICEVDLYYQFIFNEECAVEAAATSVPPSTKFLEFLLLSNNWTQIGFLLNETNCKVYLWGMLFRFLVH